MEVVRAKASRFMIGGVPKSRRHMLELCMGLGFRIEPHPEDDGIERMVREP